MTLAQITHICLWLFGFIFCLPACLQFIFCRLIACLSVAAVLSHFVINLWDCAICNRTVNCKLTETSFKRRSFAIWMGRCDRDWALAIIYSNGIFLFSSLSSHIILVWYLHFGEWFDCLHLECRDIYVCHLNFYVCVFVCVIGDVNRKQFKC